MASYSITGWGVERCYQFCSYCSCASIENYTMGCKRDVESMEKIDEYVYEKQYKADWNKVEETLRNDPQIKREKNVKNKHAHCDLWGADSTGNLLMLNDMITHLTDIFHKLGYENISFSDSTGGICLLRDEVADYHKENNIHIQLSHDGLGQFIRTRDIDVLEYQNTKDLIKAGILNAVNTTLSFWNNDIIANYKYWTDYLRGLFPTVYSKTAMASPLESRIFQSLYIKLNHIYNGTTPSEARNELGIWNGKEYDQLKGVPYGDFNLINDRKRADEYGIEGMAHALDDYIHSYTMMLKELGTMEALPFRNYFEGQINRYRLNKDTDTITGACRAYQRGKYKIGDPKGWKDSTFVIDTMGNYSECNLIYSKYSVKNPGGVNKDYCKGCKYETASECMVCGCEAFPGHCEYNYRWNQFLEEMAAGLYKVPPRYSEVKDFNYYNNILKTIPNAKEKLSNTIGA